MSSELRHSPSEPPSPTPRADLERALLLTLVYSDLFDYPLTRRELRRYLVCPDPGDDRFESALQRLVDAARVEERDGYLTTRGRAGLVDVRTRRQRLCAPRWRDAERYARSLWRVPFVRLVAVCGSQAMENGDDEGDVDIFCVAEEGRLWIVQVAAMLLRRLALWRGVRVCPNYFLSHSRLQLERHDLYTARELSQLVPLVGAETYEELLAANPWVTELLPNVDFALQRARLAEASGAQRPAAAERWEHRLEGRLGTLLDRALHRLLLLYYPLRLWRRGWSRARFRNAYRTDRQEVMAGGYAPAIQREFLQRARQLHTGGDRAELDTELGRLFPTGNAEPAPDPLYRHLFATRYGADVRTSPG